MVYGIQTLSSFFRDDRKDDVVFWLKPCKPYRIKVVGSIIFFER